VIFYISLFFFFFLLKLLCKYITVSISW